MKLFERTGGYYLFWVGFIYLTTGLFMLYNNYNVDYNGLVFAIALALPFIIPPFGRWLNLSIDWDLKMFEWWKNRSKDNDESNVVKFPEPKETPKMPYVVPPEPKKEKDAKVFYRFGLTDNDRVAFSMGMMEITMNRYGCQQMIDQLTFFMNQLPEDETE